MKTLFLLIFTCLAINQCLSQWQLAIGGTADDCANYIIQTDDGGYAIAGYTNSFGAGSSDMYFAKIDSTGMLQWTRTVGGSRLDYAFSMSQTSDGGYIAAGYTNSFGTTQNWHMYIIKLSSDGTVQWTTMGNETNNDRNYSIIQTINGGYAVVGSSNSYGAGGADLYVVTLNPNYTKKWMKTIGGGNDEYGYSIIQTSDRGYAATGYTTTYGIGAASVYIVKIDSNGTQQWSRAVGGTNAEDADFGHSIVQSSDGGYVIAGETYSFGAGSNDVYLIKLSSSGALQWTKTYGGHTHDYANCIIRTTDGGYAVAGGTLTFGAGNTDMYILKLDPNGTIQWTRAVGGPNYDFAISIIQTRDGGYALAGLTQSYGAGGYDMYIVKLDANGNSCGNSESTATITGTGGTMVTTTSSVSSPGPTFSTQNDAKSTGGTVTHVCVIGIKPNSNEIPDSYKLYQNYPNPFNPTTKIKFSIPASPVPSKGGGQEVSLKIYDILGKEVESLLPAYGSQAGIPPLRGGQEGLLTPGTYEVEWNALNFPSGIYFYKLIAGDFSQTKKLILLK